MKINVFLTIVLVAVLLGCRDGGSSSGENIFVYDTREILQCARAMSLEESAQRLVDAGVDVLASTCGYRTGVAVPTVCGVPSTAFLAHKIREANLADAEDEGFLDVATLVDAEAGTSYEFVECAP